MKTQTLFLVMSVFLLLTACDPTPHDGGDNYWASNALVRLQLKGAVKTITQNETTTEFNSNGQTVRVGDFISYSYDAQGRLVSVGTTTFQYNNLGKYVPNFPFHMNLVGLTPNLSAVIGESSRTNFTFEGDSLLLINEYTSENVTTRDTTKMYYADKYPTNYLGEYSFMRATYQSNGMFDVYTEGFYGIGYTDTRNYTYKKDADYLLLDKIEESYVTADQANSYSSRTDYTYNASKDIVLESQVSAASYYKTEYYDYEYDAKGNWTSRKIHSQNNSEVWDNERVETRAITYF